MIYVAKPTGDILGRPNGIKEETCKLKKTLTDMWELTFEVNKYVDENGDFSPSDFYESLSENMYLTLESDTANTLFLIDAKPVTTNDGIQETKSITAHTAECELQQKFLRNFYINNGTPESQEYLAADNVDPYTGLPQEYIRLVNFDRPELSLLHLALQETGWTVDENLLTSETEACTGKYQFSADGKDIYSFLMNEVAPTANVLFFFDRRKRRISFRSYPHIGRDTGICIGMRNLASRIQIESTTDAALITAYRPACESGSGIEYVNFGDPCLYNLDYFADTHNEYGDYQYVTENFHDEYAAWKKKREDLRPNYTALTREYNQILLAVSELQNRLPNDGCSIDYKTYKADELAFSLNAYEKALTALITLYKNDYPDLYADPGTELDEAHLRTTVYWHDYFAYKCQIIPSVLEAMKIWYETDADGSLKKGEDGSYLLCENGNPAYAGEPAMVKPVNAFLYEFDLYGLAELQAKKKAWMECVNLLYRDGFIASGTKESPEAYLTPDKSGWEMLTADQKAQFTTITAFTDTLASYLDYMSFEPRANAITGTNCKGIIRLCEDAISKRQSEIDSLQVRLTSIGAQRDTLSSFVRPENHFSTENLRLFRLLTNEAEYSNKNIVTTNLDDIVTVIDAAEELYQDAKTRLDIASRPQYAFRTTIDNLFALEEFAPLQEDFTIGNFIRLLPDLFCDDAVKLRLISIELNPLQVSGDISVEFSTMTRSLSDVNDLAFLFGEGASASSHFSGSASGNGGTYGKNDAEIQIANNMLNALLKSEAFGTQVSDVILDSIRANKGNFGKLLAHSGIFDSLESGGIKINGDCLTNAVKSNNYNGSPDAPFANTSGTIIDLVNGDFNFGGGKLKLNGGDLLVQGDVIADSLVADKSGTIAGWRFDETGFYKIGENGEKQMVLGDEGISAGENFSVSQDGKCDIKDIDRLDIGRIHLDKDSSLSIDKTALSSRGTDQDKKRAMNYTLDTGGFHIYNGNPSTSFTETFADLLIQSLGTGGFLKLRKQFQSSQDSIDTFTESKADCSCVVDTMGIHGTSKTYQYFELKKHIMSDDTVSANADEVQIFHLDASGTRSYFNPFGVLETEAVIITPGATGSGATINFDDAEYFEGFGSNDTHNEYVFEYGRYIVNDFLLTQTSSSGSQLRISSSGMLYTYASSSRKYKYDITDRIADSLDPRKLYDLPVVQFKYKKGYLNEKDDRHGQDIIGFLAEDVYDVYPIACNLKDGEPEVPEYNMLIAPMLKLIQEQHEEIEKLKQRIAILEQKA